MARLTESVSTFHTITSGVLDLIYPPVCLLCRRDSAELVCEHCKQQFPVVPAPNCPVCGRSIVAGACAACTLAGSTGGWGFVAARAGGWHEGLLREAIHQLKYRDKELLAEPLGDYLAERVIEQGLFSAEQRRDISCLIPVPLHWMRRWRRGFNQAELLGRPVAKRLGIPLFPHGLRRTGRTRPQVGLTAEERRANISEQLFEVTDAARVRDKGVLLLDDVATTGTTLSRAAHTLLNAGAKSVYALTLSLGD